MSEQSCIIVGAGHAGTQLGVSLRQGGWTGSITLIGEQEHLPYHRPPLSKGCLVDGKSIDDILIRSAAFYETQRLELLLGTPIASIDTEAKSVALADGVVRSYDFLALATGSSPRRLTVPGSTLPGIVSLERYADAQTIKALSATARTAVIVGGGYIGMEVASSLCAAGVAVTVIEAGTRVLERVASPQISQYIAELHRRRGVNIVVGAQVCAFEGERQVTAVRCADGQLFAADLVIVGIGAVPNTGLAQAAGLRVEDGILVDGQGRTSDPSIFAAGDCTRFVHPGYGYSMRVESVQNATEQAKVVAAVLCGQAKAHDAIPWFWSDQYDTKLQMVGLLAGHDEAIVRGDLAGAGFAIFYLKQGRLQAVEAVNSSRDFMFSRRLIDRQGAVDAATLADPSVDLAALLN